MRRHFQVPSFYKSQSLVAIKDRRQGEDPKRKDFSPTIIEGRGVRFKIARHFGFCFGVENAIDIAYRALEIHPDKRIFLLSEMIHNPEVNADLKARGVEFLMAPDGQRLIDFNTLSPDDVVIVPAFGTTVELQHELETLGIDPYRFDATCPFVQKVWKRAEELGKNGYTVIVHGKPSHEETRATFSHSRQATPTLVVRHLEDTRFLADCICGRRTPEEFWSRFSDMTSEGFSPEQNLERIGVVNQTTMLATETQEIAEVLRKAMQERYGENVLGKHFADTRDTLCYATYENQRATRVLVESGADLAIVVGGYNSSNTSHLVELATKHMPTYYIRGASEILSRSEIRHFDLDIGDISVSSHWLPAARDPIEIAVTSGASCPDRMVEEVIERVQLLVDPAGAERPATEDVRG